MLVRRLIIIFIAFVLDLCFGDPRWLYHPVCMIGNLIGFCTNHFLLICHKQKTKERLAGLLLVIIVLIFSVAVPFLLLVVAYKIHIAAGIFLEAFWCYQLLAAKSLRIESKKVLDALKESLEEGQKAVAMIVGRDTSVLDEKGVIKAAVETVAENTTDGVVAPLLFMSVFGTLGGFFYKAVNTMDSMVGYRNEKYRYFGTAAAKLDDICNWIPSRISAIFMIMAAGVCHVLLWIRQRIMADCAGGINYYDIKKAFYIWIRDRRKHKSPNSAQTEAVCAGAMQIQLAGDAYYFGKKYEKPFIGDDIRPIEAEDINRAGMLMYVTSIIVWIVCICTIWCVSSYLI